MRKRINQFFALLVLFAILCALCACGNKEKTVESPNVSIEPSMETTETPDTKGEDPAETIKVPNVDTEDSEQETEIPDIGAEEPVETSTPSDAGEKAPVETPETPEPKPADKEEVSEPSISSNQEEAMLCCAVTESAPDLDIVGHYTDDWGFPVSLTFYPTGDRVRDFRIVSLKMLDEPKDGVYFEADSVLLDVGMLEPGQGVVAEVCFMDSPIRGISFADQNGKHVYALGESGEDGSLIIYDQGIRQDSFLYEGQDQDSLKVFFAGYEPFNMETVASYDNGEEQWIGDLIFTTFGQIADFNIVSLNWYNMETGQEEDQCENRWNWEENHYCTIGEQLLHVDSISQGQAVSVKMNVKNPFDDILPIWGVTYTDAAGVKHAEAYAGSGGNHEYALIISNYDIHPKDAGQ